MKRLFVFILVVALALSLSACGGGRGEKISLSKENITDYITFSGEFTNSEYYETIFYYVSSSTIDFQTYSTVSGTFENVEITLRANINDTGVMGEQWHLANTNASAVEFTFKLPANGNYSHSYAIECDRNSGRLKGNCNFTVVSVSGTYIPA